MLQILKKNYARLCQCLPPNYERTVEKLKQLMPNTPEDFNEQMKIYTETEVINEVIMSHMIFAIRTDDGVLEFCDVVDKLCDNASKQIIEALRYGNYAHEELLILHHLHDQTL